jgi:hypothetical protein
MPALLIAAYGYARVVDEPATRLADYCAIRILAIIPAIGSRLRPSTQNVGSPSPL